VTRRISKAQLCAGVRKGCVVEMGASHGGLAVGVFEEPCDSSQPDTAVIRSFQWGERD